MEGSLFFLFIYLFFFKLVLDSEWGIGSGVMELHLCSSLAQGQIYSAVFQHLVPCKASLKHSLSAVHHLYLTDTHWIYKYIYITQYSGRSETELTASVPNKRSQTHKRLKESFLIRGNGTKPEFFFRKSSFSSYIQQLNRLILFQFDARRLAGEKGLEQSCALFLPPAS